MTTAYGFWVVGSLWARRQSVDWRTAFAAYCACDDRAQPEREAFFSHFTFGRDLHEYLTRTGSEAGFTGPCGTDWLHWDIDRADDLDAALRDARRLSGAILDRYRELGDDDLLIFLSGGKGFHVGVAAALWGPPPSTRFHEIARRFALAHAELAGVTIDPSVYSKARLFRAPNSRHPRTGLFKRRLTLDELMGLSVDGIVALARQPEPFAVPTIAVTGPTAAADWRDAAGTVERRAAERKATYRDGGRLTKTTMMFIREGATEGERATSLFRAAANLAELGCPDALAHALLTDAALDSGLTPSETARQIDCGLAHGRRQKEGDNA